MRYRMKVLFLGAGTSIDAGYPIASTLLDAIEKEMASGADVLTKDSWTRFDNFRKSATAPLSHILNSPNPEVVLSYPDLLVSALRARDWETNQRLREAIRRYDQKAVDQIAQEFEAPEREDLWQGLQARHDLLKCLHFFLGARNCADAQEEAAAQRDYLRRELSWLSAGDVIITTNWDTLAERILAERLLWSPVDGYGFPRQIVCARESSTLPAWFPMKSALLVLKLHGSFGWHVVAGHSHYDDVLGYIFLDFDEFLSHFPFFGGDERLFVPDTSEPAQFQPENDPLIVYPSFLKQLEGVGIQTVWEQARLALEVATEVRIVGASLPDSDAALRSLLNPLRFGAAKGAVSIAVHNPDSDARTRWREFLGDQIICKNLRAGEGDFSVP